jgi:hypothetical protein
MAALHFPLDEQHPSYSPQIDTNQGKIGFWPLLWALTLYSVRNEYNVKPMA